MKITNEIFFEFSEYEKANAVVLTFLVDNHDLSNEDIEVQRAHQQALDWETKFVEFMQVCNFDYYRL